MRKIQYDLLTWKSFPSSLKVLNDVPAEPFFIGETGWLAVTPTKTIKFQIWGKGQRILGDRPSRIAIDGRNGGLIRLYDGFFPKGTFDWHLLEKTFAVPSGVTMINASWIAGNGYSVGQPATTWFDDLKIYQDDVLIYDNYFTAIRPGKIIPTVIQPPEIIVGAVQRFKAGRTGEEVIRAPMTPIL